LLRRENAMVLLVPALCAFAPRAGAGQLAVEISAGVRSSTALVRDSIVTPFDVRPALAPALAVTLAMPLERSWAAHVTVDLSTSELQRHDADGSSVALGRVSTASFTVGLGHPLPAGFSARIGVGGLKYFAAEEAGIFRLGSGAIAGIGTLALSHTLAVGKRLGSSVEALYDIHGFTTPALQDEGFGSARTVHRVALTIRVHGRRTR
jgi:hypothetical protein